MYVCLCYGITEQKIKNAIERDGVGNLRQLRDILGVGSQCGKCVQLAQQVIDNTIVDSRIYKEAC